MTVVGVVMNDSDDAPAAEYYYGYAKPKAGRRRRGSDDTEAIESPNGAGRPATDGDGRRGRIVGPHPLRRAGPASGSRRASNVPEVSSMRRDTEVTAPNGHTVLPNRLIRRLGTIVGSPFAGEVLVLLVAAGFVQAVFPYRHDWPAHLAAGGGGVLVLAGLAPARLGRSIVPVAYLAIVGLGWLTEHLVFGPPDPVDVAFTLAGTLLTLVAAPEVVTSMRPARRSAATWGVAVIVVSLAFRYGMSIGPA